MRIESKKTETVRRAFVIILAILFVLPVIACSENEGGETTGTSAETPATGSETRGGEYDEIDSYLNELAGSADTAGMTFTFIGRSSDNFPKEDKEQ